MSITKQFVNAFDPMCKEHALWLLDLHDITQVSKDPKKAMTENPFKITVSDKDVMAWIDVMVGLSLKYSMSTLRGESWTPEPKGMNPN
jgi:hypothetical protein